MIPDRCPICQSPSLRRNAYKITCLHCAAYSRRLSLHESIGVWAEGKQWWWRLIVVAFILWLWVANVQNSQFSMNRLNPLNGLDLGMHELGHILFIPFGEFMTILGGSIFQCLFPVLWIVAFWRKRWYFALPVCFAWLAHNLFDVAAYVADARARLLPLATFSSDYDSAHDWYQILSRLGALQHDTLIANTLRGIGSLIFITSIIIGLALIIKIARAPKNT